MVTIPSKILGVQTVIIVGIGVLWYLKREGKL